MNINLDDFRNPNVTIQGGTKEAWDILCQFMKMKNQMVELEEKCAKMSSTMKELQQQLENS